MFRRKDELEQKPSGYTDSGLSTYTRAASVQAPVEDAQVIEEQESAVLMQKPVKSPFETVRQFPEKILRPTETTPTRKTEDFRAMGVRPQTPSDKPAKRVMTVGQDSFLKGEISTCDRVIVEGQVDAKMTDVLALEVTEGGSFKGSAIVEEAEISGVFEGDISVKGRLMIYSTGKVSGKIRYGEIEVQRGGRVSGEVKSYDDAELPVAKRSSNRTSPARGSESHEVAAHEKSADFAGNISELFAN